MAVRAHIFLNEGKHEAPEFGESTFLQAGGEDATVPSS